MTHTESQTEKGPISDVNKTVPFETKSPRPRHFQKRYMTVV